MKYIKIPFSLRTLNLWRNITWFALSLKAWPCSTFTWYYIFVFLAGFSNYKKPVDKILWCEHSKETSSGRKYFCGPISFQFLHL